MILPTAAGLSCWIMMQGDTIDQAAIPDLSVTPSKISGSNFAFSGDLRLNDADSSNYVGFKAPTTVSSNIVWTLPAAAFIGGLVSSVIVLGFLIADKARLIVAIGVLNS